MSRFLAFGPLSLAVLTMLSCRHPAAPHDASTTTSPSPALLSDERACAQRSDYLACRRGALEAIDHHDDARAFALAQHACSGGYLLGCKTLGWLHENGRGTPKNAAIARQLYERACNGGELGSCKSLALLWDTGQGGPTDRARAAVLYQRACDAREWEACNNLANLYLGGDGVPRDPARAASLYDRVCTFNHNERACANAREIRSRDGGM